MTAISVRLSPEILHQLRTTGLTSAAAADLLGVGPRQACRLLRAAGATQGTSGGPMQKWKMGPR